MKNRIWIKDCSQCAIKYHSFIAGKYRCGKTAYDLVGENGNYPIPDTCPILAEQAGEVCEWKQDEETGSCSAKCGFAFYLEWDSPAQNGMVYCPRCGRKIKEVPNV